MKSSELIQYEVRCCSPKEFPIFNYTIAFRNGADLCETIYDKVCDSEWGCKDVMVYSFSDIKLIPDSLYINWLSIYENKQYCIETGIPTEEIETFFSAIDERSNDRLFDFLIVGIAPLGSIALWIAGQKKSRILLWLKAKEIDVDFSVFFPNRSNLTFLQLAKDYGVTSNSILEKAMFDNYMNQFTYRYLPLFEHWDDDEEKWTKYTEEEQSTKPELDYIEETLYDGTHDKLHDGGLLNYHEAGKPKKLCMKWHVKKSEYTAYYWLDDQIIRAVFDKFYGTHPDTKTDFIIHVDPVKNKYQLALYRYGLKEPVLILEDAYQLIVFKNKFEYFRSENYDQPKGAWIW